MVFSYVAYSLILSRPPYHTSITSDYPLSAIAEYYNFKLSVYNFQSELFGLIDGLIDFFDLSVRH